MKATRQLIIVCAGSEETARDIKDLLEFMDADPVEIADVGSWRDRVGNRQLAAVFAGPDLDQESREQLLREVGEFDPSVSVVVVDPTDEGAEAAAA
ncbi:MAG: hypothetical protein R3315_10560 [Woeseiaceae bacterium]|nr:hypothetical protein [Woeseiaceae bacterium]